MKVGLKDMKKAYKNVKIDKIEVCFQVILTAVNVATWLLVDN